jgi:predicted AAA+ superfamily ATPase
MRERILEEALRQRLETTPAVVLLGSRQVGKTTMARAIASEHDAVYLDLESPADRAKLSDPEQFLTMHLDRLVVLDEVHRVPQLFPILRGRIDEARRRGKRSGLYLLLGSASIDLIDRSAESLAGRVSYLELHPLSLLELETVDHVYQNRLWLRGGYPDSVLADTDAQSYVWRSDFVRTYLEREVPHFAPRKSTEQMRQLWTMLAHLQGQVLNASMLARSLGTDFKTVQSYVNLLEQLLLVRTVQPWHANVGKRLTKRPKLYVRDSGIVHSLLGIRTSVDLLGHPVAGGSWEGFVHQQIATLNNGQFRIYFYRTSAGAEIDILLQFDDGELWAIEVKSGFVPSARRGFYEAIQDLSPKRAVVVYGGTDRYPLRDRVEGLSVRDLLTDIVMKTQRG